MRKPIFEVSHKDEAMLTLMQQRDHQTLAIWAINCVERVLPYFEAEFPDDNRPQTALRTLQAWIDTGEFRMTVIRKASLDAHAAARDVGEDSPARSVARSAGQAVATAHVLDHAIAATNYALQAIHRATDAHDTEDAIARERAWQYQCLLALGDR